LETSCRPAHSACWPTRWTGRARLPLSTMCRFLRRSTAASTAESAPPVTLSASSTIGLSPAALAAAAACGDTATLSIPLTSCVALSIEAASAEGSFLELSKTRISGSVWTPGNRFRASDTAWDPEPGTSKPPAVRCFVCCAANGTAATTSTIHTPRTSRLRRVTNRSSRSMAARMPEVISRGADSVGFSPCPFGSVSPSIWPCFSARARIQSRGPKAHSARQGGSDGASDRRPGARRRYGPAAG